MTWQSTPSTGSQSTTGSTTNVQIAKKPPLDLGEPILDPETAADLLFQEIGGIELAEMLPFGTVSGINQKFNVVTNLDAYKKEYDPTYLISDNIKGFGGAIKTAINLSDKIPNDNEFFIRIENYDPLLDDNSNTLLLDLIITLQNIEDDEELEIEVVTDGKIYEVS